MHLNAQLKCILFLQFQKFFVPLHQKIKQEDNKNY